MPTSHAVQLRFTKKSLHRCAPLVDAAMLVCVMSSNPTCSLLEVPKVKCNAIRWNQLVGCPKKYEQNGYKLELSAGSGKQQYLHLVGTWRGLSYSFSIYWPSQHNGEYVTPRQEPSWTRRRRLPAAPTQVDLLANIITKHQKQKCSGTENQNKGDFVAAG